MNTTIDMTRLLQVVHSRVERYDVHTPRWAYVCVVVGSAMVLVALAALSAVRWMGS